METTGLTGETVTLRILKGMPGPGGAEVTYAVPGVVGMVVLDAIHYIQHNLDTDLACRWNCKAAKCGSCSAEVNGRPVLLCKTRVDELPAGPISVHPMKTFPWIKDLVTDVSRNFEVNKEIPPFTAEPDDGRPWRIQQVDIDRLYEHRRCIECFLCQDVCHILRTHNYADRFYGPRFFVRVASLEMHPKDILDRRDLTRDRGGLGYCNITKCCTEVCPEHIHITDNAIIPLKERVADERWDPMRFFVRQFREHLPGALRARRAAAAAASGLPDPAKPPKNRGPWDEAALTNVEITEIVKRQIHTNTRPWEK
jgi:succinate dehydrogenase / fumarate reductase iron-sulfur subunit